MEFALTSPTMIQSEEFPTRVTNDLSPLLDAGEKFSTIYADPPWLYDNQATENATGIHYQGLSVEELAEMPVFTLSAESCQLHLWTTNGFLFDSQRLLTSWGFDYKSCLIWCKSGLGMGNYWRVTHEFLLLGVRGQSTFKDKTMSSWVYEERGRHSYKPERFAQMVERAGSGPRLELFGRRPRTGWTVFGNQIDLGMFDSDVEVLGL